MLMRGRETRGWRSTQYTHTHNKSAPSTPSSYFIREIVQCPFMIYNRNTTITIIK